VITTDARITVPIAGLHAAVRAVIPHADRPKLGDPELALARVRVIADKNEVLLAATNGRTSALAAVDILEDSRREVFAVDDGPFVVDVHPKILRDLKTGVTAQKVDGDLMGDAEIVLSVPHPGDEPGTIALRDVSGLWIGSETIRPLLPLAADYPDVVKILRDALANAEGTYKPLVVDGPDLAVFRDAAAAYGEPLEVEPVGEPEQRGWLVFCGDDFAGSIVGRHTEDSMSRRNRARAIHMDRLGLVGVQAEVTW
jgi:hypothetical protein